MQLSKGKQYAVLDEEGAIVDMNRAFSLALGGKAAIGDALHAVEHPLAISLCDVFAQGEITGSVAAPIPASSCAPTPAGPCSWEVRSWERRTKSHTSHSPSSGIPCAFSILQMTPS